MTVLRIYRPRSCLGFPPPSRFLPARLTYALPPSLRTQKSLPAVLSPSTRNDVLDFALSETAKIVDNEARRLTTSTTPLACPKALDWSHLHNFHLTANEEQLSEEAPGLFTILSTVAVRPDARQRLESHTTQPDDTPGALFLYQHLSEQIETRRTLVGSSIAFEFGAVI